MIPRIVLLLVAGVAFLNIGYGDSWGRPKKSKYYSSSRQHYLKVVPRTVKGKDGHFQALFGGERQPRTGRGATASFYCRHHYGGYQRKWTFPLLNYIAPTYALVADSGEFVVTFDNWHTVGYGDDVVVIYRSDGTLVRKFGLDDLFTESDIGTFSRSTSSIWWGGRHYIGEDSGLLVLNAVSNGKGPYDNGAEFYRLKIDLATGETERPKRDVFPDSRPAVCVEIGPVTATFKADTGEPSCSGEELSFDSADVVEMESVPFLESALVRPTPEYPKLARMARIQGYAVVEVLVSGSGEVLCARSLSAHSLFEATAVPGGLKWRFDPFELSDGYSKVRGVVGIDFRLDP